jgi:hypothetical protein
MATWDDVRAIALALPQVVEGTDDQVDWSVGTKKIVWERPLRTRDLAELGDTAPTGVIGCVIVQDESERRAMLEGESDVFFTTSHFGDYPAVLFRLAAADAERLAEVITDAWLARAPKALVKAYLAAP